MAGTLVIKKVDITKMDVDCIVNAATEGLQAGCGVCGGYTHRNAKGEKTGKTDSVFLGAYHHRSK